MTKESYIPDDLAERIANAPAHVTVFSDGSTFDYENGYQNNGAPTPTRDTPAPKIVKYHKIFTFERLSIIFSIIFFALFALLCLAATAVAVIGGIHETENWNTFKDAVNNSNQQVTVIGDSDHHHEMLLKRPDGSTFKCDVSFVSNDNKSTGYGFCAPGGPATFTVPVPHDPNSIFSSAIASEH